MRRMIRIGTWVGLLVAAYFFVAPCCAAGKSFVLVEEGAPQSAVVLGKNASPVERHASEELRAYLKKVSGAEVTEVSTATVPSLLFPIFLGTPSHIWFLKTSILPNTRNIIR